MTKKNCCLPKEPGASSVYVSVDVTKIVKYICFAGIAIVGIIFGTKCYHNLLKDDLI